MWKSPPGKENSWNQALGLKESGKPRRARRARRAGAETSTCLALPFDDSPCGIRSASPARGCWPWPQGLEQGVAGISSLASQQLEVAATLWPYPVLLGQEAGGRRGHAQHNFYICGAIIFKCLGCKPASRSPDSQALLCTL